MTIIELIEKMKKEDDDRISCGGKPSGVYAVLRSWCHDYLLRRRRGESIDYYYGCINGILHGLLHSGVINEPDYECIRSTLDTYTPELLEQKDETA